MEISQTAFDEEVKDSRLEQICSNLKGNELRIAQYVIKYGISLEHPDKFDVKKNLEKKDIEEFYRLYFSNPEKTESKIDDLMIGINAKAHDANKQVKYVNIVRTIVDFFSKANPSTYNISPRLVATKK